MLTVNNVLIQSVIMTLRKWLEYPIVPGDSCLSSLWYSKTHRVPVWFLVMLVYSLSSSTIGAVTINSGPTPPILIQDGDCQPGSSITQFRTRIEATGQTADIVVTTYPAKKMDLFRVYLMDGKNTVLDSTGRSVIVGIKRVFDPVFFVVRASPSTGPFRIIVYEEASLKKPIVATGSIAKFDAALVRAELDFDAHALDPDCPAASTRGG